MRRQRLHLVIGSLQPLPAFLSPIDRCCRAVALTPLPAFGTPQFAPAVTAVVDEPGEFTITDRGERDFERPQRDAMRRFFIVEHEISAGQRTQHEITAGYRYITRIRCCGRRRTAATWQTGIAQRLARIGKRFAMHFFVCRSEFRKIAQDLIVRRAFQPRHYAIEHVGKIAQHCIERQ